MSSPTKLLVALAVAASAISFNAIGQTPKTYNFKVTYDGSKQTLDAGSDPIQGTTLNVGDRFALDIRAAGTGFFESKINAERTFVFPFASLHTGSGAKRTGNIHTKLLLDGIVVSELTELSRDQLCVHIGADHPPAPLTVGLRFDQVRVEYEFLAIGSADSCPSDGTTVLQEGTGDSHFGGGPVFWAGVLNPAVFAFNPGFASDVVATDLKHPQGVAVWRPAGASKPVIYIADRSGHRVWKLDLNVSSARQLVAGTGVQGYFGDGGPAVQAELNGPASVAVDATGNVYVADAGNHIVRKIDPLGIITTVAGTPKTPAPVVNGQLDLRNDGSATLARLNGPRGVAVAGGKLYMTDTMNQQVRVVEGGTIRAVVGLAGSTGKTEDGPVSSARLNDTRGLAVDANGNVYIAEVGNNRVLKIDAKTLTVSTAVAGLRAPAGVAVAPDGTLYISDTSNHRVLRVATTGAITTVAGTGTPGPGAGQLNTPAGLALDTNGDLYIADQLNNRIVRVDFSPD